MQPWSRLPHELDVMLRPFLPEAVQATVAAIADEVPAYATAWDSDVRPVVQRGTEIALGRLLDLFGTQSPALDAGAARFYRRIGAVESRQGRSLESLLSAYRVGARIAWERMSTVAVASDLPTGDLVTLAEAIFVYIDVLSAASAQGHATQEGQRDVMRSRLVELLLEGQAGQDPVALQAAADAAGWTLPERMAVAVVPLGEAREPTPPADVIVAFEGDEALAILPDPSGPGRRAALQRAWEGSQVFVGTVRPPAEAPVSLAHARRVQRLVQAGRVPDSPIVVATDYLPELVIGADPDLLGEVAERALRPVAGISATKRQALLETLAAWLAFQGDRTRIATALHVHPQTVSYRLGRLRETFGRALDDPHERLTLQLVLGVPQTGGGAS
ncbi:MAG: helix-turn-helix domain-containing protein [Candidatus Nanopelagicales bacterium]